MVIKRGDKCESARMAARLPMWVNKDSKRRACPPGLVYNLYSMRSDLDFPIFSFKWMMCLHRHLVFRSIGGLAPPIATLGLRLTILMHHPAADAAGTSQKCLQVLGVPITKWLVATSLLSSASSPLATGLCGVIFVIPLMDWSQPVVV
jgi:hypothetical protein